MDSLGLSLLQPDFLICSFYKVFGENPSGFGCLFVKNSAISILDSTVIAGISNIVSARKLFYLPEESLDSENEIELDSSSPNSFSGQIRVQTSRMEKGESSTSVKINGDKFSEIEVIDEDSEVMFGRKAQKSARKEIPWLSVGVWIIFLKEPTYC